ncbi:MAG: type II toxin-antitoxin system RelE/ParE family toxin [Betaproteobacteria bacterium]|nr:type II toxin-antitoxin system RelE/ParE family toxin [Betaproteobacteria bacterium]
MPRLIWTGSALTDVERLYQFLALKSPDAARRAVGAIRGQVRILATQPGVGRALSDTEPEYHIWPIDFGDSGYVVLYRFDSRQVTILAVRHQREAGF